MKPVALLLAWLVAAPLSAAPILPAGHSPALDAAIARHERQFYGLNALPFGLSLDTWPANAEGVALIDQFLAGDAPDFAAATGKHPFDKAGLARNLAYSVSAVSDLLDVYFGRHRAFGRTKCRVRVLPGLK